MPSSSFADQPRQQQTAQPAALAPPPLHVLPLKGLKSARHLVYGRKVAPSAKSELNCIITTSHSNSSSSWSWGRSWRRSWSGPRVSLSSVVFALSAFVLLPANRKTHKNILPITINNSTGAGRAHRQSTGRGCGRGRGRGERSRCASIKIFKKKRQVRSLKLLLLLVACCLLPVVVARTQNIEKSEAATQLSEVGVGVKSACGVWRASEACATCKRQAVYESSLGLSLSISTHSLALAAVFCLQLQPGTSGRSKQHNQTATKPQIASRCEVPQTLYILVYKAAHIMLIHWDFSTTNR